MGSSAQKSSGVHWCRRRVRFNEVPENVPKFPEKVSVQSRGRFNRVPEKVPEKVLGKVWEAVVQSQVRFNRVPKKVPEKVWEALVQSRGRCGRLWSKARSGSTGFRRRFQRMFRRRSGRL